MNDLPLRLYPLQFEPIFKSRIWGGRNLERLYLKALPPAETIGESWEITDRDEGVSRVRNGPLAGRDLRWLMENARADLLGNAADAKGRFPLLIKILDAAETLSLQVHPPADVAEALGGEPKTEMWFLADAAPGAMLYVGLKRGVTREEFERRIADGSVAECFHQVPVRRGDAMFLPSGRVHAIGAGCVIFEIQQNSDTTYRVFDWNRRGADGKPRELHVSESLRCIDFNDFEPDRIEASPGAGDPERLLADDGLFRVVENRAEAGADRVIRADRCVVIGTLGGAVEVGDGADAVRLGAGEFCLIPAGAMPCRLRVSEKAGWLECTPG